MAAKEKKLKDKKVKHYVRILKRKKKNPTVSNNLNNS